MRFRRASTLILFMVALGPVPGAPAAQEAADRLILTPKPDTIFEIEGHYPQKKNICEAKQRKPLRAKYRGRLELSLAKDGTLKMVNGLTFDQYLRGLAEVPLSWKPAALRAQIIAARSYALHGMRRDRRVADKRGYDICSTDQCQVYRGATVELGAFGERWIKAVGDTEGKVLTYRDNVIQAFYFSTSDGKTRRSFPGGTPQPWLPSVDGEDADAPLARWTARIRRADLGKILAASGDWPGGSVDSVRVDDDEIVLSGDRGNRRIALTRFRIAMNNEAPCLYPKRYPAPTGSAAGTKLPQTIPSTSFSIKVDGDAVVLRGRGWGHFVGMSQWGAQSLAERGRSHRRILKHFYGPADIETVNEPDRIRVLAAEGMRLVRISVDGGVRVTTGTGSRLKSGKAFEIRGGDSLRIERGRGPSLKPVLTVTPETTAIVGDPGEEVTLRFESARSVRVTVELLRGELVVVRTKERSIASGKRAEVKVRLVADNGAPLEAGTYAAVIEAYDGLDRIRTKPVAVTVRAPSPSPSARALPADSGDGAARTVALVIAGLALAGAAGLLARSRFSRR